MIAVKKGDRVSEYVLEEPLGRGGFGEVWRARHYMWSDRQVAVKIPTSPDAVKSLANEGLLQSSLEHPGIARSLGMDTAGDPPYFITEYVEGQNLRQILESAGPLETERAAQVLEKILDILEYAHTQGVVHQDIKPENIMLTPEGDVKLTDFGLGQTVTGESILLSVSLRTNEPSFAGTFPYIAPEIRDGAGNIDARVDLFSLGIVVFEMLTGKRPVGGEVPSDLREGLPAWCDDVFRGLHTRRSQRLPDVPAVREKMVRSRETVVRPPQSGEGPRVVPLQRAESEASSGPRVTPLVAPQDKLIPSEEACEHLGISGRELRHWIRRGHFNPVSLDGAILIDPDEVEEFRRRHPVARANRDLAHAAGRQQGEPALVSRGPRRGPRPQQLTGPDPNKLIPAGFFPRTVAMLVDFFVIGMVLFPVAATRFSGAAAGASASGFAMILVGLYFSLSVGLFGRTVGKACLGMRVIRIDRQPVTVFDGFVRTINYLASLIPFGLGFFSIIVTQRKLGFHDLLCGTQVVYDTRPRP